MAGRNIRSEGPDLTRRALVGAVLSVAVSIIPLITVMQVADGMIQGITARYVELGTYHAQIIPFATNLAGTARAALADLPELRGAWLETQSVGVAFANGSREGVAIRAVEPGFLADPGTVAYLAVSAGSLLLERSNDVLIGTAIAGKLGLAPGDILNLITLRNSPDGGDPLPRVHILRVAGIVSAGYRELDSQWIFIRQDAAGRIVAPESSRTFVGIKVHASITAMEDVIKTIRLRLPQGFSLYSWRDMELNLFESLASTRTMLLLIMTVTVLVAAINVSSALSTLVLERHQEIAILKSLGALPTDLATVFSLGGAVLGAAGATIGVAGGLLTSININRILHGLETIINAFRSLRTGALPTESGLIKILDPGYYLETIPINVQFRDIAMVAVLTVLLSFMASIVPANRAARLSPLELFRRH
jgi:lipoprotein-releasing system permease protein